LAPLVAIDDFAPVIGVDSARSIDEVMAVRISDVVDGADALPDVRFQQRAAQQVQLDRRGSLNLPLG